MDLEKPFTAVVPAGTRLSKYISAYETDTPIAPSTASWNNFLANHPDTADALVEKMGEYHGELHALDVLREDDNEQLTLIANACNEILGMTVLTDGDFDRKRDACRAKLGTVVRMQNPGLATEECIVFKSAKELDRNFELDQAMMYRYQGVSLDTLNSMPNPADEMLRVFNDHIDEAYNLPLLESKACRTLAQYIEYVDQDRAREFETMVGYERLDDPSRVMAFGANVTSRLVALSA